MVERSRDRVEGGAGSGGVIRDDFGILGGRFVGVRGFGQV